VAAAVARRRCSLQLRRPPDRVAADWQLVADGRTLAGVQPVVFGGDGDVQATREGLVLEPGSPLTGVTFDAALPRCDYEVELAAARLSGTDFFCGLTLPTANGCLSLILGGWGGAVCGLSCLDGRDAANNATRCTRGFERGRVYRVRVRVTAARVDVDVDGSPLLSADLRGRRVAVRAELDLCQPFGVASFATRARIADVRWRPLR
jgi:hypothetical protein